MRAGEVWGGGSGTGFGELSKSRWMSIGMWSVTVQGGLFGVFDTCE